MKIEIEDSWWLDPRRDLVVQKIGFLCESVAIRMWRLGLEHWKQRNTVPRALFFSVPHAQEFLDAGLAKETEEGFYIKGSESKFQWYHDGIEQRSLAGKRSAEVRKKKYGTAIPKNASNLSRTETEREPNETEPTSTSTSLSNLSSTLETTVALIPTETDKIKSKAKPKESPDALRARETIRQAWIFNFKARYGFEPTDISSVFFRTQLKRVHEALGETKACNAVKAYLQWDDPFIAKQAHPIALLLKSLDALRADLVNPKAKYAAIARGRAQERVMTEQEQRLEEMKAYAKKQQGGMLLNGASTAEIHNDFTGDQPGGRVFSINAEARISQQRSNLHGGDAEPNGEAK